MKHPDCGWEVLNAGEGLLMWARAARRVADEILADPVMQDQWLQCEGTWFVGVDALPTGPDGRIGDTPLPDALRARLSPRDGFHPAQLSAIYPGYPRPRQGESEAAFRYRLNRDGAHVDGILPVGPDRRRFVREPHAYVLGVPLTDEDPLASPLVVWEGSHRIMADAFASAFGDRPSAQWPETDITDVYTQARRRAFEDCPRREISAAPGQAILLHRLLLHGISPWRSETSKVRAIAYFRPLHTGPLEAWIKA